MQRNEFLKSSFKMVSAGALVWTGCSEDTSATADTSCVVTEASIEGPYPYPGGEYTNPLKRVDITGGQEGVPLSLTFTVVNTATNCTKISDARIDIWYCNKDGYYSGYDGQSGTLGEQGFIGEDWLRGYQMTDAEGSASFKGIYPGWYDGRATHIHLELFLGSELKLVTQLTFPETISDSVHTSFLYHGVNPVRNATDAAFKEDEEHLSIPLTGSIASGYEGTFTLGLNL